MLELFEYPYTPSKLPLSNQNVSMSYVDEGQGDVILCVHGNPTWSYFYRNLIRRFKKNYRVIAPDHIGMGLSDQPEHYAYNLEQHVQNLTELINKLDLKNITIVAHDWGGAISMGYAVNHPQNIKKIILMNTAAFRSSFIPKRINILKTPIIGKFLIEKFNLFAYPATFMAVEKPLKKSIKKGFLFPYKKTSSRMAITSFVHDIPMNEKHPTYNYLKNIEEKLKVLTCPIYLLWGAKDFCFNLSFLNQWKEFFPKAKVDIYPHYGHYLLEDAGEDILNKMESFLETKQ